MGWQNGCSACGSTSGEVVTGGFRRWLPNVPDCTAALAGSSGGAPMLQMCQALISDFVSQWWPIQRRLPIFKWRLNLERRIDVRLQIVCRSLLRVCGVEHFA